MEIVPATQNIVVRSTTHNPIDRLNLGGRQSHGGSSRRRRSSNREEVLFCGSDMFKPFECQSVLHSTTYLPTNAGNLKDLHLGHSTLLFIISFQIFTIITRKVLTLPSSPSWHRKRISLGSKPNTEHLNAESMKRSNSIPQWRESLKVLAGSFLP